MKSQRMLHLFLSVFLLTVLFCGCNEEKKKPLLMVTDATFPPYEFRDGKQITGIDPEIIRELAKAAGFTHCVVLTGNGFVDCPL